MTSEKTYGDQLPRRRLGRTNMTVPAIALGGAGIGSVYGESGEKDAIEAVQYALAQGINYIDTSPLYGDSQRRIGIALQGVPRDSYLISTKTGKHPGDRIGDYTWDGTMRFVEESLHLLHTDYIDLLLVHDPEATFDAVFAPRGALEALEHLKATGVIGAIGLGQRRHDFHLSAIDSGRFDAILTYNDYHPLNTSAANGLLQRAGERDVGVLNGSPLAQGLLTGQDPDEIVKALPRWVNTREIGFVRKFHRWCQEKEVSMLSVVFQFCLRQPLIHCTLTGAKNREELAQNLQAATTPLPEDTWDELDTLNLTSSRVTG